MSNLNLNFYEDHRLQPVTEAETTAISRRLCFAILGVEEPTLDDPQTASYQASTREIAEKRRAAELLSAAEGAKKGKLTPAGVRYVAPGASSSSSSGARPSQAPPPAPPSPPAPPAAYHYPGGDRGRGPTCFRCGEVGHIARNCENQPHGGKWKGKGKAKRRGHWRDDYDSYPF